MKGSFIKAQNLTFGCFIDIRAVSIMPASHIFTLSYLYTVISFLGGPHFCVTAEKTKREGQGDVRAAVDSAEECVCHSDFTGQSKSRIKCEKHTETTLKSMRRRQPVAPPRLATHNDKEGGGGGE